MQQKLINQILLKKTHLANLKSDLDKLDIDKLRNAPKNLSNLKSKSDKLGIEKLETTLVDLSKLSNVVKNIVVKKTVYDELATRGCENEKYLASIIDDLVIMFDEVIEEIKTIPTNFNEKIITCKIQNFYTLLTFLLVTIALLTAVILLSNEISSKAKTFIKTSFILMIKTKTFMI